MSTERSCHVSTFMAQFYDRSYNFKTDWISWSIGICNFGTFYDCFWVLWSVILDIYFRNWLSGDMMKCHCNIGRNKTAPLTKQIVTAPLPWWTPEESCRPSLLYCTYVAFFWETREFPIGRRGRTDTKTTQGRRGRTTDARDDGTEAKAPLIHQHTPHGRRGKDIHKTRPHTDQPKSCGAKTNYQIMACSVWVLSKMTIQ